MKIKIFFARILILITSLTLTSCFDIIEEINMKSNGGGNIKATLNLSKSKTKVASLMKLDKVDGFKIPKQTEIRQQMSELVGMLQKTPGISNAKYTLDMSNYIATVSCDFAKISALNTFTKMLSEKFKTQLSPYSSYAYDAQHKAFVRVYRHNAESKTKFDKLTVESKKAFEDASYTNIIRFEDNIASSSNKIAKVSSNKKAVMLRASLLDIINGHADLTSKIKLN